MSRPTIVDVAKVAGVSKATVSRVLSGNAEYMRPQTRERVLTAIEQLNYRPSNVARSLTSKRTYTAGILVSDVGNPFYPEVIYGVEDVALNHNYNIFLCNTSYDLQRGLTLIHSLADKQVDGLLIMSSSMSDEWVLELTQRNIPAVILDWDIDDSIEGVLGLIEVDFEVGISAAVQHLVELGHQSLAHISGPLNLRTSRLRQNAFLQAAATHGIPADQTVIIESDLRIEGGRDALNHLLTLPQPPTAVFAANDLMAMGVVRAARASGLQVPQDLSVVGLDDIWLVADMEPPLTTVALPRYEIGSLAMQMLFDLLEQDVSTTQSMYRKEVATHLVVRQSTATPKSDFN